MNNQNAPSSGRENIKHGDIFLPINSYHSVIPESYRDVAIHWHEEMEITLIRKGTSDYRVGQETFRAKSGDLILVLPYCTHSAKEIPGETMVSDSLVFGLEYLGAQGQDLAAARYLRPLAEGQLMMPAYIGKEDEGYGRIRASFLAALKFFRERPPFYELHLREELLHIIILLFELGHLKTMEENLHALRGRMQLKNVLQYISEHYREKLSISRLADITGYSESYFMNLFREQVGTSCVKYINNCRLQNAARQLDETDLSVMAIAMDNGFSNISYFNLQFRKTFGMTPGQFRQRRQISIPLSSSTPSV